MGRLGIGRLEEVALDVALGYTSRFALLSRSQLYLSPSSFPSPHSSSCFHISSLSIPHDLVISLPIIAKTQSKDVQKEVGSISFGFHGRSGLGLGLDAACPSCINALYAPDWIWVCVAQGLLISSPNTCTRRSALSSGLSLEGHGDD